MMHPYAGIVLINKEKWATVILNNPDESQKYVEWKKSDTQEYRWYDFIHMKSKNR